MTQATGTGHARAVVHGTEHVPLRGERQKGRTNPETEIEVTLLLRRRRELPDVHEAAGKTSLHTRQHMSRETLRAEHGTDEAHVAAVERFAREHKLEVTETHHRSVVLKGSAEAMERAFGVELNNVEHHRGEYRAASTAATVPHELRDIVQGVLGLNTRPCARRGGIQHRHTTKAMWSAEQMARAYGFAAKRSAEGQTIALIELGGGYREEDLREFCKKNGVPMPNVRCVSIDEARNTPAAKEQIRQLLDVIDGKRKLEDVPQEALSAAQCTVEVTMDIELAAALAPGAEIVVYMAPATEQGIYHAVSRAISHTEKLPSAIAISWGEPETEVPHAFVKSIDEVLREAALLGVTMCASSGDEGAMNGSEDGEPRVNFPASSPHALSCGGTFVSRKKDSIADEKVWNRKIHGIQGATGGGVSRKFELPLWQKGHDIPESPEYKAGRGVPDVAGPADPHCGCEIVVGGETCASAGTSAVAPMWAALVACANAALGVRAGFVTPLIYELAKRKKKPLRDVVEGDNGYYKAGRGWNACTGLGTPIVDELVSALGKRD